MWLYIALVIVGFAGANTNNDKLVFVQAVWRHGDRAPTTTFPNDPYQESHWPQGWGELSPRGMSQHLHLGVQLAQRYITETGLVSNEYKSNEVYVRSSDVNRTLLSATSNFIGFYGSAMKGGDYPVDEPSWPAGFVPVPVHTVDEGEDYLLTVGHGADCPRLQALQDLWKQTKEYKAAVLKYQ
ncbi:esophageal gland cell secretory protein 21, partial [Aphelenchoides avenae]